MRRPVFFLRVAVLAVATGAAFPFFAMTSFRFRASARAQREEESIRAFSAVASVLLSPRCLNCHVPGDSPLQGDAQTPHSMNVKRGPDGRGTPAMRCTNCHQETNSEQLHAPPGAPDWRLPSPSMPLIWKGLSVGGVCRTVRNPATNGGKNPAHLIEHVRDDPFVNWAWNPGPGRTRPPLTHGEFVARFTEWLEMGAACPQE